MIILREIDVIRRKLLESLKHIDHQLFNFINHNLSNGFCDWLFPYLRIMWLWVPLYIILFWLLYKNYGLKKTIYILIGFGITIAISDALIANSFKHFFGRMRPCHYPDIDGLVPIIRDHCGSGKSFISAHATNHFAIALYYICLFKSTHRFWLLLWAGLIAFASVYIGVHYPADVAVGAVFGMMIGGGVGIGVKRFLLYLDKTNT